MRAQFKNMLAGAPGRYSIAIAAIVLALILRGLLAPLIGGANPHALMLMAVVIGAWYGGRGPGIVATLFAALASSAVIFPLGSSRPIADTGDQLQLAIFLVEGLILSLLIGTLHARLHNAEVGLRTRDDLLAVAAHELKTPLTAVIGYTQTLQVRAAREGNLTRRDQDTLRVIAAQAKRLHMLIDSVLDLTRLHNGQMQIAHQPLDLATVARQAVADARLTAARHLLDFRAPETPVRIVGDTVRLEQVIRNLLDNAVKYSPADRAITVGVEQQNAEAVLTVSDQGIGIPEAARARLFERFYRASNLDPHRVPGTGIGLSIVTEIVALHGGVVEVESAEGRGSTFTVRLPLQEVPSAAQSAKMINWRRSVPLNGAAHQLDRPAAKDYHEHIH